MEKYLIILLDLNSRVIVPELGAFIIRQNESKDLVFNDLLAFDDGMLTDHIMQAEKLSKSEAQNRIRQFTETVKKTLDKGDTYSLEKLGTLKMDDNNRIEFSILEPTRHARETPAKEAPSKSPESEPPGKQDETKPSGEPDEADPPGEPDEVDSPGDPDEAKPEIDEPSKPIPVPDEADSPGDPDEAKPEIDEPSKPIPVPDEAEPPGEPNETESHGEPDEAKPEIDEPSVLIPIPNEVKLKIKEPEEQTVEEGGFVLADVDTDVDIDATKEDPPLKPDGEEPPFQIEDENAKEIGDEKLEIAYDENQGIAGDEKLEIAYDENRGTVAVGEKLDEVIEQEDSRIEEEEKKFISVTSEPSYTPSYTPSNTYNQSTKKKSWPWIVGAVALAIILLVAGWFIFPEKVDHILGRQVAESIDQVDLSSPEDKEATPISDVGQTGPDQAGLDQTGPNQTGEEVVKETEAVAATLPVKPQGSRYYVVAGCFSELTNAQNYVQKLLDQGYDASIFGTHKNLHAVCFNSHSSKQAAVIELNRIKNSFDSQAWILFY